MGSWHHQPGASADGTENYLLDQSGAKIPAGIWQAGNERILQVVEIASSQEMERVTEALELYLWG